MKFLTYHELYMGFLLILTQFGQYYKSCLRLHSSFESVTLISKFLLIESLNLSWRSYVQANYEFFKNIPTFIRMLGLMIFSLLELLYDFYKLKSFALETHALNQAAYQDKMTGIPNRYSCDLMFSMYTTSESIENMGCCLLTISNLAKINEHLTHEDGDKLIQDFCELLETSGDRFGFVGRNSGNEFLAIIEDCQKETMEDFISVLNQNIEEYNKLHQEVKIEIGYAYILNRQEKVTRFTDLITLCYKKLNLR